MKLPKIPPREWVAKFMAEKKIDDSILQEYLFGNVLTKFLQALAEGDETSMRSLGEKTLVDKVMASMPQLQKAGLQYTKNEEVNPDSIYVIDKLFLKGISADRGSNDSNFDYVVVQDSEKYGLKQYKHKYQMGYQRYYYLKRIGDSLPKDNKIEDPILFTERERKMRDEIFKLKKEMGKKDLGLIFRVSVQITDGALGKL